MRSLVPGYRLSMPGLGTQWWEKIPLLPTLTRARKAHFLIGLLLEGFLNSEMAYWLCGRQLDPPHTHQPGLRRMRCICYTHLQMVRELLELLCTGTKQFIPYDSPPAALPQR